MSVPIPFLTEGLPMRRRGVVSQATATIRRAEQEPGAATKSERLVIPLTFPAQIPMGNGWRLQHASPTTGLLVTQNWLVDLFHSPKASNLRLNSNSLANFSLLKSIAAAFTDRPSAGFQYGSLYTAEGTPLLPGSSPTLTYYRPLEAPEEQYLLLYDNRFAPGERPNEEPSLVNLYALVQVELDEEHFIFLLRQAIDAAYEARWQR